MTNICRNSSSPLRLFKHNYCQHTYIMYNVFHIHLSEIIYKIHQFVFNLHVLATIVIFCLLQSDEYIESKLLAYNDIKLHVHN